MKMSLDDAIGRIEAAYANFGYTLGWEFLYGPASTLACPNGLMLMGINPGGDRYKVTQTVEAGNDYLIGRWSKDGTILQSQVLRFFEVLAASSLGRGATARELLNATLTTNFCPFVSPTWKDLPNRAKAVAFSNRLWSDLLGQTSPKVIICMGRVPFPYLESILRNLGKLRGNTELPTGWGAYQFRVQSYGLGSSISVLARIPHFSQYRLMSRAECLPRVQDFVRQIEKAFGGV